MTDKINKNIEASVTIYFDVYFISDCIEKNKKDYKNACKIFQDKYEYELYNYHNCIIDIENGQDVAWDYFSITANIDELEEVTLEENNRIDKLCEEMENFMKENCKDVDVSIFYSQGNYEIVDI